MVRSLTRLISDSLSLLDNAAIYEISRGLADLFPSSYILETEDYDFDLSSYAEEGRCHLHPLESTHAQFQALWQPKDKKISLHRRNALYEVLWRGHRLHCLEVTYGSCDTLRSFIIADSIGLAREFFSAVSSWNAEAQDDVIVFSGSRWRRDPELREQIKRSTLDALVLPGNLREDLIADFEGFFASKELYKQMGVAWKRGLLLLGAPGNGKTHCIKAMVQRVGKPCLYVRSFRPDKGSVHSCISMVFRRARELAPCVLVLEDLDSLVDDANRSLFLNEMDGFAENEGILIVGTTNHPGRLDPALTERPSRFDRKITFDLPALAERRTFLALANEKRDDASRLTQEEVDKLAELTEEFSFAYLKELGLSSIMAWMRNPVAGALGAVMFSQVETLRNQMKSEWENSPKASAITGSGEEDDES